MRLALKHKIVLVLVFSLVLTIITGIRGSTNDTGVKTVKRPPAGEVKEVELSVTREGDTEPLPVHLKVDPRSYSKEEAGKILESVVQNLPELIKGNNKDLDHVTGDLKLDTSLTDINVTAQWSSSDFETVSFDGQVFNTQMKEGEAKDVELPVQLSLGEALAETVVKIRVLPREYSPEEKSAIDIDNALGEADREAALKDEITLPTEVNGRVTVLLGIEKIMDRRKRPIAMCANVDMYSGLIYDMLGIPADMFTPLFASARMAGWCAHRMEEIATGLRIMRPAYRAAQIRRPYIPVEER